MAVHHRSVEPQVRHASIGAARRQRLVGVTGVSEGHRQPVTALTVIMALHRHPSPQARQASIGAARLSTTRRSTAVTERHRQPVTALTVIMAVHHRSVEPQARPACYGRGHPVNDSDVTEHHRPPRWRSSGRIICIRRTPNGALSCERGHPVNSADRHPPRYHV